MADRRTSVGTTVVVVASVAAGWLFAEEREPRLVRLQERSIEPPALRLAVPPVFWSEIANLLAVAVQRGRIAPGPAQDALTALQAFGFEEFHVDWSVCLAAALAAGLTAYDSQYLQLAKECGAPLWTVDRRLERAASAFGVPVGP